MERAELKAHLDQGLSLAEIGEAVGKDASTIGYWVRKHRLQAVNRDRHAPRGGVSRDALEALIARDLSTREIAAELDLSLGTIRHWLKEHGLQTQHTTGALSVEWSALPRDAGASNRYSSKRQVGAALCVDTTAVLRRLSFTISIRRPSGLGSGHAV